MITNVKFTKESNQHVSAIIDGVEWNSIPEGHSLWKRIEEAGVTPDPYVAPAPTIQQQIDELEAQQTPRLMREAIAGELFATTKLAELDAEIATLRAQL